MHLQLFAFDKHDLEEPQVSGVGVILEKSSRTKKGET